MQGHVGLIQIFNLVTENVSYINVKKFYSIYIGQINYTDSAIFSENYIHYYGDYVYIFKSSSIIPDVVIHVYVVVELGIW